MPRWLLAVVLAACAGAPPAPAEPPVAPAISVHAPPPPLPPPPSPVDEWTAAVAELDRLDADVVPYDEQAVRRDELRARVDAALAGLPDDHPRVRELLCRSTFKGRSSHASSTLWRRIYEIPHRDPRARFDSLLTDTVRLLPEFAVPEPGDRDPLPTQIPPRFDSDPFASERVCPAADYAMAQLNMIRLVDRPRFRDALFAEIAAELGPEDPRLATLLELDARDCDLPLPRTRTRSSGPARVVWCLHARPPFERALALRERALGETHPLTRASLHNLAAVLLVHGDRPAAEQLLHRLLAAPVEDAAAVLATRLLAELDVRRGDWQRAAQRLDDAFRLGQFALDLQRSREFDLQLDLLHLRAAVLARDGRHAQAAAAWQRAEQLSGTADARTYALHIADALRAAGEHEHALPHYDRSIAAWTDRSSVHGLEHLIRARQGRAAALAGLGRADEHHSELTRIDELAQRCARTGQRCGLPRPPRRR